MKLNRLRPRGAARRAVKEYWGTPAPGYRHRDYGTLYDAGGAGYIWSSTIPAGSGSAHYLYFGYGGVSPQNYVSRGYGFQLRCLQE